MNEGSIEGTIVFITSLVVAVLVAQTILMGLFIVAFRKWTVSSMNKIDLLTTATMPLLQSMRDTIEEARVRFHSIGANLEEISALTRRQVQKVDGVVSDATERAQLQIVRLDGLVSDTIEKVERTSETLQRGVVKPVQEISAIVAGVKTAVDFLRHRKRGPVEHATQDEEMFI